MIQIHLLDRSHSPQIQWTMKEFHLIDIFTPHFCLLTYLTNVTDKDQIKRFLVRAENDLTSLSGKVCLKTNPYQFILMLYFRLMMYYMLTNTPIQMELNQDRLLFIAHTRQFQIRAN